jgi:hypothetical protein
MTSNKTKSMYSENHNLRNSLEENLNHIETEEINKTKCFYQKLEEKNNFKSDDTTQSLNIIKITPNSQLNLWDIEAGKKYHSRVILKNLMDFPIMVKLRSSDNKKIEIKQKIIKLKALQKFDLELIIYIDKFPILNSLFIFMSSDLFEINYQIIVQKHISKISNGINEKNTKTELGKSKQNKYKFIQDSQNDYDSSNDSITIRRKTLIERYENEGLKKKIEVLKNQIEKNFINDEENYNSNKIEISLDEKIISNEENSEIIYEDLNKNLIKEKNEELVMEKKINFSIDKDQIYSNKIEKTLEENKKLRIKLEKLMKKFKEFENLIEMYKNMLDCKNDESKSIKFNDSNFLEQETKYEKLSTLNNCNENSFSENRNFSEINLDKSRATFKSENLYTDNKRKLSVLTPKRDINIIKLNCQDISNEEVRCIKERFLDIEMNNFKNNQIRLDFFLKFIKINECITKDFQEKLNDFENPEESENNNQLFIILKNQINQLESILIKSRKYFSDLINQPLAEKIDDHLTEKLLTFSESPSISKNELNLLFKEIQNLDLLTNELSNLKLENKNIIYENEYLKNELCKYNDIIEKYRSIIKNLEMDFENFKANKHINNSKDENIMVSLQDEINFVKSNFINPEDHFQIIKKLEKKLHILEGDNSELFSLLTDKDKEIVNLKLQINILSNQKRIN